MEKEQNRRSSDNLPPAERTPYESSISSSPLSSLSHDGEGSEHSLHPSPTPLEFVPAFNRSVPGVPRTQFSATEQRFFTVDENAGAGAGGVTSETIRKRPVSISRRSIEETVKKVNLGFRGLGFLFCLISFSIMAADRNKGWALDSFDRYIEFRYCLAVNVIGFIYSALQGMNMVYQLSSGKLVSGSHLRYILDFACDQMLAYLLMSSSSSAATRVEEWKSNWGKDKFPNMANAFVAVSFMAFVSLASSSLISGYNICTL